MSNKNSKDYTETPWPWIRNAINGALEIKKPHTCWGFGEVDITDSLQKMRTLSRQSKTTLSLTAFVVYAHAQALRKNPLMLGFQHGKRHILFKSADILTMIERQVSGHRVAGAHIVRAAEKKTLAQINWELRQAMRADPTADATVRKRRRIAQLPTPLRRLIFWHLSRNPHRMRAFFGNTAVTTLQAPGMTSPFWGLPPLLNSLAIGIGAVVERPHLQPDGQVVNRKHLCYSGAADHGVIDGAPLARYNVSLTGLLREGIGLDETFVQETLALRLADRAAH